ncbi:MAG: hypothetical protein AAGA58_05495 [Verrucomicrobiota bacterium]
MIDHIFVFAHEDPAIQQIEKTYKNAVKATTAPLEADEVEICKVPKNLANPEDLDFIYKDSWTEYSTFKLHTLKSKEATVIEQLWNQFPVERGLGALCHNPGYVLRFKKNGQSQITTSICWQCGNFRYWNGEQYSSLSAFDVQSDVAQSLLALLSSHF